MKAVLDKEFGKNELFAAGVILRSKLNKSKQVFELIQITSLAHCV